MSRSVLCASFLVAFVAAPACVSDAPSGDGSGSDAGGGDASGGDSASGDGAVTTDGGFCKPLQGQSCPDANTLQRCNADGSAFESVTCVHQCATTPTPHCKLVTPTGIAPVEDFNAPGLLDTTLDSANVLHSDTGQIEGGARAASDPSALSVNNGIGFHVAVVGGHSVGVFVFKKLTINGTPTTSPVTVVGPNSVVLLATDDVSIAALSVAADCTANTPGPGGFAGGTPASTTGSGPGGGGGGAASMYYGGSGGGGHADHGGDGAFIVSGGGTAGTGGPAYDDVTLSTLRGGSGGGSTTHTGSAGGAGGGAVQIVSQGAIAISHGIAAGACGGKDPSDGTGGGGGGAGGAILLEAISVSVADSGYLVAGGGGGAGGNGASAPGNNAATDNNDVIAGNGGICDTSHCGGAGANLANTFGAPGTVDTQTAGSGGGGAGYVRINTLSGAATLSNVSTMYVPPTSATTAFTQGTIVIQ